MLKKKNKKEGIKSTKDKENNNLSKLKKIKHLIKKM
jgi:hypothetical protein